MAAFPSCESAAELKSSERVEQITRNLMNCRSAFANTGATPSEIDFALRNACARFLAFQAMEQLDGPAAEVKRFTAAYAEFLGQRGVPPHVLAAAVETVQKEVSPYLCEALRTEAVARGARA